MDIIWGTPAQEHLPWAGMIALYLFLAGIAGGGFLTASLTDLLAKNKPSRLIKAGSLIAPSAIVLGLGLLVLDLSKPFAFWKLLIHVSTKSVMSIGTFIISAFVTIAFVYALMVWGDFLKSKTGILAKVGELAGKFSALRKPVALLGAVLALCTTTYTGFLLSAVSTNPLWSVPFLGLGVVPFLAVLFLISGVSTGLAATLIGAAKEEGLGLYKKADSVLIVLEIILLVMLYLSVNPIYFSGTMSSLFWIGVVMVGLLLPLVLSIYGMMKHRHWVMPVYGSVIVGGLCLRYFIVFSGQMF